MTKVLIADSSKPSLVMSSEVFKDKIPGSVIYVATTGRDTLELISAHNPEICLVDFDLPDVDGATLIVALRKIYQGPILMTAFPTEVVDAAVSDLLFHYNDASSWIRKPVRFETLSERIDNFLIFKRRIGKRFDVDLDFSIGKTVSNPKKSSLITGRVFNLSFGGVCLIADQPDLLKKQKTVQITIQVPVDGKTIFIPREATKKEESPKKQTKNSKSSKMKKSPIDTKKLTKLKTTGQSFRAEVAWVDGEGRFGLRFAKLTSAQKSELEKLMRLSDEHVRSQRVLKLAEVNSNAA